MKPAGERTALNSGNQPPSSPGAQSFYFVDKKTKGPSFKEGGKGELEMKSMGDAGAAVDVDVRDGDGGDEEYDEGYGGFRAQFAAIGSWLGSLASSSSNPYTSIDRVGAGSSTAKPRKVPVKVEPKVFFANERTFLAWLHMSVTLASISVAIVAFAEANKWSQMYGLLLMPCAIAFCGYSLYKYIQRAGMIRRKDPGPYEDLAGPIVLSGMLGLSIVVNFFVKLWEYSS